jgi:D-xylose 1-dehydrogenase (NADP+, D-xylono-1,5-lactone-forming)
MIATARTLPAMGQASSATPPAIASRGRGRAEDVAREHGVPRVYGSCDELLADPNVAPGSERLRDERQ